METDMQETSLEAYTALAKNKVKSDYQRLLRAISSLQAANNTMLANYTGLKINIVCPRMNELRKLGKVELDRKDICPYNKTTTLFWRIKNG